MADPLTGRPFRVRSLESPMTSGPPVIRGAAVVRMLSARTYYLMNAERPKPMPNVEDVVFESLLSKP